MLRFASIGSGSQGNGLVVGTANCHVLLDCGFSVRETVQRLTRLGLSPAALDGLVVTHEHADHGGGVMDFALKFDLPVWLSYGTLNELGHRKLLPKLHIIETDRGFSIADLEVHPFTVPHDAKEPLQFVFDDGQRRLGVLTDTGTVTPYIAAQLSCCHALMLECNHDPDMLRDGPYPDHLKKRVGGRFGHLSNQQAAELLRQIHHPGLQHVIAAHLSQKNNRPELAARALSEALAWSTDRIDIAGQVGLVWHRIN